VYHQTVTLWRAFKLGIVGLTLLALPGGAAELRILAAGAVREVVQEQAGLCRKFCSGGHEGTIVPVGGGITRPERRTVRPQ
jgi:hypothetical protein